MQVTIKTNYLVFPIGTHCAPKEIKFSDGEKTVYSLDLKIDNFSPDFYTYVDVARFKGQTLYISAEPDAEIAFTEADDYDLDKLYNEPYRPQIHFTAKSGWLNDPNGLIYLDGTYHMFFQVNPGDVHVRKDKHWGHAVSRDLIHWTEEKTALFPDRRGAMFSGCAVLDEKNLLGKNNGDNKTAVLFYTTTEPYAQNMSYSTDNFKTIEHYEGNPIIEYIDDRNRDPKVVFCEEIGSYIMILYIKDDIYYLFKSENLTDWVLFQSLNLEGERECPDIFPITDGEGNRKWIIMGACDKYLVGEFENGKFVACQDVMSLHYGISAYAGQTFSNMPDGRIVRMVWNRWKIKPYSFSGHMGIPMELSLGKDGGKYYLKANPARELESLYKNNEIFKNADITSEKKFCVKLEDSPYLIKLKGEFFKDGVLNFSIFGRTIELDFFRNQINFGECTMPISLKNDGFDVTVIVDRCGMEIFTDGGRAYMSCAAEFAVPDRNSPYFTAISDSNIKIDTAQIVSLNSIWK